MQIKKNSDLKKVEEITIALKENDGYCPCALEKTKETKCMCKDFRDKISNGYIGYCHCGLYVSNND